MGIRDALAPSWHWGFIGSHLPLKCIKYFRSKIQLCNKHLGAGGISGAGARKPLCHVTGTHHSLRLPNMTLSLPVPFLLPSPCTARPAGLTPFLPPAPTSPARKRSLLSPPFLWVIHQVFFLPSVLCLPHFLQSHISPLASSSHLMSPRGPLQHVPSTLVPLLLLCSLSPTPATSPLPQLPLPTAAATGLYSHRTAVPGGRLFGPPCPLSPPRPVWRVQSNERRQQPFRDVLGTRMAALPPACGPAVAPAALAHRAPAPAALFSAAAPALPAAPGPGPVRPAAVPPARPPLPGPGPSPSRQGGGRSPVRAGPGGAICRCGGRGARAGAPPPGPG